MRLCGIGALVLYGVIATLPQPAASALPAPEGDDSSARATGPEGGEVTAVASNPADPNTIYVGTSQGGAFRSDDAGQTWKAVNSGLVANARLVSAIVLRPDRSGTVLLGTADGVYSTATSGATWSRTSNGIPSGTIRALAIEPASPSTAYAGVFGAGVFKSTDAGATWNSSSAGIGNPYVGSLSCGAGVLYAGTLAGMFRSTNGGGNWSAVVGALATADVRCIVSGSSSPSTTWAGTFGGGIFKTADVGLTWSPVNAGLTNQAVVALAMNPQNPLDLLAGTHGGVLRSTDGGDTWSSFGSGLPTVATRVVHVTGANAFIAAPEGQGIYRTDTSSASWSASNTGLIATVIRAVALHPTTQGLVYACAEETGFFRSTDLGKTWSSASEGLANLSLRALVLDPFDPATLYVATHGGGLFKSTTGGDAWAPVNAGISDLMLQSLAADPLHRNVFLAGSERDGIFKTTDGGGTWRSASFGLSNGDVFAILFPGKASLGGDTVFAGTGAGVSKSTDGGLTWGDSSSGIGAQAVVALGVGPRFSKALFATTRTGGVYTTRDGGQHWTSLSACLPNLSVMSLALQPGVHVSTREDDWYAVLFAGTDFGGVFVRRAALTTALDLCRAWQPMSAVAPNPRITSLANDPTIAGGLVVGTMGNGVVVYQLQVLGNEPHKGPYVGGNSVTITGVGFAPGTTVSFGETSSPNVVVVDSATITAVLPPHPPGIVDVVVELPDGRQTVLAHGFEYDTTPVELQSFDAE